MTIAKILTTIFVIAGWCLIAFVAGNALGRKPSKDKMERIWKMEVETK